MPGHVSHRCNHMAAQYRYEVTIALANQRARSASAIANRKRGVTGTTALMFHQGHDRYGSGGSNNVEG